MSAEEVVVEARDAPQERERNPRHFAWFPTKTVDRGWIWLKPYWRTMSGFAFASRTWGEFRPVHTPER